MENLKKLPGFLALATLFTVVLVLALIILPAPKPVNAATVVDIVLLPATSTVTHGNSFNITVQAQAGAQTLDSASVFINYDQTKLQANSITPGAVWDTTIASDIGVSGPGEIEYSAGMLGSGPISGTFTVCTINFTAISGVSDLGSAISFNTSGARTTDVALGGTTVLDQLTGATVKILGPINTVKIQDGSAEGSAETGAISINTAQSQTVYAHGWDSLNQYLGLVTATWSWQTGTDFTTTAPDLSTSSGTSTTFNPNNAGADAGLVATANGKSDSTGAVTVVLGPLASIRIDDAAGGTGSAITTATLMVVGGTLDVYAVGYDIDGNFKENASVNWTWASGDFDAGDLTLGNPSTSNTWDPDNKGTGVLRATRVGTGETDDTGTLRATLVDNFLITPASTLQQSGQAFSVTITARDSGNNPITTYTETASLSMTSGSISPTTIDFNDGTPNDGIWTGNVTVTGSGTVRIRCTDIITSESANITLGVPKVWQFGQANVALIAPYPSNPSGVAYNRAALTANANLTDCIAGGGATWFQVLEYDESTGVWSTYYSGDGSGSLTQLQQNRFYYVVVDAADGTVTIPQ